MRRLLLTLGALLVTAAPAQAAPLAHRCVDLETQGAPSRSVRLQPVDIGRFLLYLPDGRFVARDGEPVQEPSPEAEWSSKELRALSLTRARGCARYPEADTDVGGKVRRGRAPWAQTRGLMDSHLHWIAGEAFGGDAHCGRPWDRYGAPYALVDCPDHEPGRPGLTFENVLSGANPAATHDTTGWPTFADWPNPTSLTHENTYYRWVERAHRGGLRMAVVLFFDNAQLCSVWPTRSYECGEMETVRRQIRRLRELQRYIDAQAGGPGRGWMRIVRTPFAGAACHQPGQARGGAGPRGVAAVRVPRGRR